MAGPQGRADPGSPRDVRGNRVEMEPAIRHPLPLARREEAVDDALLRNLARFFPAPVQPDAVGAPGQRVAALEEIAKRRAVVGVDPFVGIEKEGPLG